MRKSSMYFIKNPRFHEVIQKFDFENVTTI